MLHVSVQEARAHVGDRLGKVAFESSTIHLITWSGEELAKSYFDTVFQRASSVVEKEPQSELRQLVVNKVFFQGHFFR